MDGFIEKIVKKKKTIKDMIIIGGIILITGFLIMVVMSIKHPVVAGMALLLAGGIGYLGYRLTTAINIEFEYIVTSGDLDIDRIIARRKRKRIFSGNCKDFDIVAKVNSEHYARSMHNVKTRIEAVSTLYAENVYFATLNYNGCRTAVFFEPNEKMMNSFKSYIPRNVYE